ncbi:MAG: peptide chain release factor N(5)-glutamine methyltransferase [bacterium]|nr:peptide chain release factor N(5)-glutamine methyltransferase [bacterium]
MTIKWTLAASTIDRTETEILLAELLKKDRSFLFAHPEQDLTKTQTTNFKNLVDRRAKSEPLAYILGYKEFFGFKFLVNPKVLIPRAESEDLVEEVIQSVKNFPNPTLVDVGTGSGCIAVSLALSLPSARIMATDTSTAALFVARKNAALHLVLDRIEFIQTDLTEGIEEKLDLIVANLPYIPTRNYLNLKEEVRNYEPRSALDSGQSQMTFYKRLFEEAKSKLKKGCKLVYEIDGQLLTKVF